MRYLELQPRRQRRDYGLVKLGQRCLRLGINTPPKIAVGKRRFLSASVEVVAYALMLPRVDDSTFHSS